MTSKNTALPACHSALSAVVATVAPWRVRHRRTVVVTEARGSPTPPANCLPNQESPPTTQDRFLPFIPPWSHHVHASPLLLRDRLVVSSINGTL
jgi:hypothetical protein